MRIQTATSRRGFSRLSCWIGVEYEEYDEDEEVTGVQWHPARVNHLVRIVKSPALMTRPDFERLPQEERAALPTLRVAIVGFYDRKLKEGAEGEVFVLDERNNTSTRQRSGRRASQRSVQRDRLSRYPVALEHTRIRLMTVGEGATAFGDSDTKRYLFEVPRMSGV